ncbi:NUDIX hydrolase (plasmid) [Coraliomargarita sp. W4R53]
MLPPSTSAKDAFAALADTLGDALPRTPQDASDPAVPVAATVVIVRDSAGGPEVLLIERPDRGSFAGAWVFPGGKLEASDHSDDDTNEEAPAQRAGIRETLEETGLVLDETATQTLSRWDPPPGLPLRIRTWFFVAPAPPGIITLAADEAIASVWVRPVEMLTKHSNGEVTLYPPTWITLHNLAHHPDVESLISTVRMSAVQHFETMARRGKSGPIMLWQEDGEYDPELAMSAASSSARHRIALGALPWIYTREY